MSLLLLLYLYFILYFFATNYALKFFGLDNKCASMYQRYETTSTGAIIDLVV